MKVDFHVCKTQLQSVSCMGQDQVGIAQSIENTRITRSQWFPGSICASSNLRWIRFFPRVTQKFHVTFSALHDAHRRQMTE